MTQRRTLMRAKGRRVISFALPCALALSMVGCCELTDLKNDNSGIPFAGEGS